MSSRGANIEQLNYAIATLNEDADDIHCLIDKSTSELANATEAGNKATKSAEKIIEALEPLTCLLGKQHRDSAEMLEEAKKAADDQRSTTAEQINILKETVTETLEAVRVQSETSSVELRKTVENSLDVLREEQEKGFEEMLEEAKKAADDQRSTTAEQINILKETVTETLEAVRVQSETSSVELRKTVENSLDVLREEQEKGFEEMQTKALKEHERTRDELQTDILGFKNATSTRLEFIEAGLTKTDSTIKDLDGKITETADAIAKKIMVPVYVAIALGGANLVCLALLLMR